MNVKFKTQNGNVVISQSALRNLVGIVVSKSYGVVKMASQNEFKDNLNTLIGRNEYHRGVEISNRNHHLNIEVFIGVQFGTNVIEIVKSIQKEIQYKLKAMLGIKHAKVNVIVENVVVR